MTTVDSWPQNLAHAECRIMKFHYRNSSTRDLPMEDCFTRFQRFSTSSIGFGRQNYIPNILAKGHFQLGMAVNISSIFVAFLENTNFIKLDKRILRWRVNHNLKWRIISLNFQTPRTRTQLDMRDPVLPWLFVEKRKCHSLNEVR